MVVVSVRSLNVEFLLYHATNWLIKSCDNSGDVGKSVMWKQTKHIKYLNARQLFFTKSAISITQSIRSGNTRIDEAVANKIIATVVHFVKSSKIKLQNVRAFNVFIFHKRDKRI